MRRWLLALPLIASLAILAAPASTYADVNAFTITDFTADYYLSKADPQGQLRVDERLKVDFTDQNHGILRAIPDKYNGQSQHISVTKVQRDGHDEPFTAYESNDNEVLKIGNAGRTVTGEHLYRIQYTVQNVIRFTSGHDEFIWNTNGTQWSQPFLAETATLHLENDIKAPLGELTCYTGPQGSKGHDCIVNGEERSAAFTTTAPLGAGETMTFMTDFPAGTFHKPTTADWWREHAAALAGVAVVIGLTFMIGYRKWRRDGKDFKGRGTIIPEYAPPDGLLPAEADGVLHYHATNRGMSATLIDLAIRGHLKIVESTTDGVLGVGKHKEYSFEKLEGGKTDLTDYENTLYSGLFSHGSTVTPKDLKGSYYNRVAQAQGQISTRLIAGGYIPKGQGLQGWWLWLLAILWFIAGWIVPAVGFGFLVGSVILVVFASLMSRRTQKGVDTKDALEGLKLYMNTAEKDRLEMLQSVNAPYAQQSNEPVKTVELFEKLLPYAIVLGVEQSWAKQFESIYTTPPDWYNGNWTAFNAVYLASSLGDSMSAMNTSFAAPSSSGSGGGGGFSGGGGGGGGGGGW